MKKLLAFLLVFAMFCCVCSIGPADDRTVDRTIPDIDPQKEQPQQVSESNWWEYTEMDKDGNKIFDILDNKEDELVNIYVDYDHIPTGTDLAFLTNYQITDVFEPLQAVGLWGVPKEDLSKLATLPGVVMLEPRGIPLLYSDIATPNSKASPSDLYSPESAWELGYTGEGSSIAVVDTGVDNKHPSLMGKWLGGVDLSKPSIPFLNEYDGTKDADDTNGHGTTCTGIAMGTGAPDGTYKGAAPGARVVDVRIGTMIGYAPGELLQHHYDASLQGILWCMEFMDHEWPGGGPNRGIDIISLSWGIDVGGDSDGTDIYSRALDSAVGAGIICINAAGNSGPDNIGFDGFAASSDSIKIAASDDIDTITRDDDEIAVYSSRGPRRDNGDSNPYNELIPDVAAPGTGITQVQFDRLGDGSGNGYGSRGSGTSYATPNIAGIVAMMIEANPDLDNDQVKEILHYTAERKGNATLPEVDPFWNRDWGYGLVDAYKAVKLSSEVDASIFDPDLQCFIMDVTNSSEGVTVNGVAWAKITAISRIEITLDGEVIEEIIVEGDEHKINFTADISTHELDIGNHTVGARAVINNGRSLEDTRTIVVGEHSDDTKIAFMPLVAIVLIFAVLGAAMAVFISGRGTPPSE